MRSLPHSPLYTFRRVGILHTLYIMIKKIDLKKFDKLSTEKQYEN